ncbi:selenium cofactor biosynthesis protein YqeC [Desulfopila inferna]|uniref:selenium cofactor biosynthesis protein YqeC n=1 Tax=Desulfopila inferna TaxID=468528 RepID=UPI0019654A06|nr:selenium cofactor biosynthesis protein YqeC [Desulfopila inferna]MBM9604470.1 putative selenium-dependent hydroxylase accessory protein YqeC [Desulfopila inferna]
MNLQVALSLPEKAVISLVGGGGKTSLMYALARELAAIGKKVLTTTTTKIYMPALKEAQPTIVSMIPREIVKKARKLLDHYPHITLGAEYLPDEAKLKGVTPAVLEFIHESNIFDFIIVEADGAAGRSLKACAPHEPVVPLFSDLVVALIGLDVVARPLKEEFVFRSGIFSQITGLKLMENLAESSIASILLHDMASIPVAGKDTLKIAFLNKADTREAIVAGGRIADIIEAQNIACFNRVIIGTLKVEPIVHMCRVLTDWRRT